MKLNEYFAKLNYDSQSKSVKTSAPNKTVSILFTIVMIPIMISVLMLAWELGNQFISPKVVRIAENFLEEWQRYTLAGINIDSPAPFHRDTRNEQYTKDFLPDIKIEVEAYIATVGENQVIQVVCSEVQLGSWHGWIRSRSCLHLRRRQPSLHLRPDHDQQLARASRQIPGQKGQYRCPHRQPA